MSNVESSQIRDRTHVPCIGRWILIHCATRKVWSYIIKNNNWKIVKKHFILIPNHLAISQVPKDLWSHKLLGITYLRPHSFVVSLLIMSDSFTTPWTVACQVPLPMGFSRQEYWSGLPFPSPGDFFLTQGLNPCLLCLMHCRQILWVPRGSQSILMALTWANPVSHLWHGILGGRRN